MDENKINPTVTRQEVPYNIMGYAVVGILCAIAIVLGIIGLIRYSIMISAITVIVLGAAFLLEGGSMVRYFQDTRRKTESPIQTFEMSAEIIGGLAGLILGILALANILPITMIAIAAIVYGGALIFGAAFTPYLEEKTELTGTTSFEIIVGIAGVILGVLALLNVSPLVMCLLALIVLAVGTFMTETTLKHKAESHRPVTVSTA